MDAFARWFIIETTCIGSVIVLAAVVGFFGLAMFGLWLRAAPRADEYDGADAVAERLAP